MMQNQNDLKNNGVESEKRSFWKTLLKGITFSVSTLAGLSVETVILTLSSHFFKGNDLVVNWITPVVSFIFASIANFTIAYFFIWKDRIEERSLKSFFKYYIGYFCSCIGGFLIKMTFLEIFIYTLHYHIAICNLMGLCISGIFNFVMNEWIVFGKKKKS